MASFLDHLAAADAVIGDHVCTPGALRPVAGADVDPAPVCIERPSVEDGLMQGAIVRAKPVAWLPVAVVADLRKGDVIEAEGQRWKVCAAATRPGDGRWWRAEVDILGAMP